MPLVLERKKFEECLSAVSLIKTLGELELRISFKISDNNMYLLQKAPRIMNLLSRTAAPHVILPFSSNRDQLAVLILATAFSTLFRFTHCLSYQKLSKLLL
jgi:hypothetical protein